MKHFNDFPLNQQLLQKLDELGFKEPTEIQERAIPVLLEGKNDFHGQAQTGTGKTLAFGLPLLHQVDPAKKYPQALIVAPTRELAVQIFQSLQPLAKARNIAIAPIYGGVPIMQQLKELRRGLQVIVGTPGRLNDHLRRKSLCLKDTQTLVLDEADIMLDMGFKQEIDEILRFAPKERSIWLFSATTKAGINELVRTHMQDPISERISQKNIGSASVQQYCCVVLKKYRLEALTRFIASAPEFYGFIFCQTKLETAELAEKLSAKGYPANALHGDMNQANRNRVIKNFKDKKFGILVATDVAARGIHVSDITHVVNYQLPDDLESYVHRIGRTGRAGNEGTAITLISARENSTIRFLQRRFNVTIQPIEIPSVDGVIEQQLKRVDSYLQSIAQTDMQPSQSKKAHIEQLTVLCESYSDQQLRNAMMTLLDNKFFKTINMQEIKADSKSFDSNEQHAEVMVNVGSQDGIEKRDIINYLMKTNIIQKNHLAKIRVIKKRSFIKICPEKAHDAISAFRGLHIRGRKVFARAID